ncbi:gliding motility-associated C-terminal domain-containing protein [Mucilaginibacter arboris]|uniref:T9SS type B sorting domain-containing protein n=1 Tax=Mucilaginibacter arboris TaxID=2682090 RepID=A0A7K1T065_9SPHI|nr:gliding motility-associated C-terminal domain-containing protein [Mucilaginibacter arboris]MVN22954.1 T9SS type B sorting domain-containing protein [Mucilaginibacter arboris]
MRLTKFLCDKRSIAATTFMAAILTFFISNPAYAQTAPAAALNFAAQKVRTSSAAQTFTIRGSNLTGNVTVSTDPPFALSKDSVIYQQALTYDTTELISNQIVYVKFRPIATGNYADSITNVSAGADSKIIALSGTAVFGNRTQSGDRLDANNIITPNGDGRNDTWFIKNIDQYPNNSVKVMDKSGNVVYSKQGYTNDWGGTYNNGPLAQGTYYYIVDFGDNLGLIYRGFITIVRD